MYYIILLAIGAIFGSFAGVVINRSIRGISFIAPRSHCESCGHVLNPLDLVPILSYIFLKGRCRYCDSEIPKETLIIEISSGLMLAVLFDIAYPLKSMMLYAGLMISLVIAIIDFKTFDIHMGHIGLLAAVGLIYRYLYIGYDLGFLLRITTFVLAYIIIYKLSKGGLGDGDIYFYLSLFLFLKNHQIIWFILISIWMGALAGVIIALKHKNTKIAIPFCKYIFLSFLILLLANRYVL